MTTWIKTGAVAIAAAAFFIGGYKYAAALYSEDIAQMREQAATAMAKQEKALALSEAMDQLAAARAESIDLRGDVERVRKLADSYRARLSAASTDSCDALRERLAGCTKLLEESAELCEEGARLSGEVAAKKDALASIIKERRESP